MSKQKKISISLWGRLAFGAIWSLIVGAFLVWASTTNWLPEAPDQFTYDLRTLYFSDRAAVPRDDIALVIVNDNTLAGYESRSPVDRGMLAQLIGEIAEAKPKAIGFDFFLTFPSSETNDTALLQAIRNSRDAGVPVVLAALDERSPLFREQDFAFQNGFIEKTATSRYPAPAPAGHVLLGKQKNNITIADQTVRYMVDTSLAPPARPAFATILAGIDGSQKEVPRNRLISWQLKPRKAGLNLFPTLIVPAHKGPAAQVEDSRLLSQTWLDTLENKIVILGGEFVDRDRHLTPLSVLNDVRYPGLKVHAQILAQLRDGRVVHTLLVWQEMLIVAAIASLGFIAAQKLAVQEHELLITTIAFIVLLGVGGLLFWGFSFVLPSATVTLAWTAGLVMGSRAESILRMRFYSRQ